MFVYQPTRDMLESKKRQRHWLCFYLEIKGAISKLKPLSTAFFHSIKLSGYKVRTKFDKDHLAVEQKNYATKIFTCQWFRYMAKNPLNNFRFKNCLFCATDIIKNSNKEKVAGAQWLWNSIWWSRFVEFW